MYILNTLNKRFWQKHYFIEHCNPSPNLFAVTLCDFKCRGMDLVNIITYLSLSDSVPLQSTISLKHPCCGITYYSNPTTVVLLARSLPTSPHPCKYRSAQTDDCATKRFDFVRVSEESSDVARGGRSCSDHSSKFQTACLYCDSSGFRRNRVRSRLTTYPV
jgi:hypothetical protein